MNFLRNLVDKKIHLWVVFVIFLGLFGAASFWSNYYIRPAESFEVTTPSGEKRELTYGVEPSLSNPDFYASVEKGFIDQKTSFITANLSTMKIAVYKDGKIVKEVPIITKGKKGSWWETPAGLYKVEDKLKKHLSSFSPVYTDWNLHFQGNFFIHGWPYWADSGEDVTSTYSGGCIRLSTEDAKAVYDLATVGMPVLVYEDATIAPYSYEANLPALTSTSYLAADLGNNYVFLKNDSDTVQKLSSVGNLLTALVATEYMDIERGVTMNGRRYTIYDVLFPLLLQGNSDAADSLRDLLGQTYAVNLSNQKAKAIGMAQTEVARGENTTSTAEDAFHLAQYLYNYRKFILDLSRNVVTNNAYGDSAFGNLISNSPLKNMPGYLGGSYEKTTEGKESALGIFSIAFGNGTRPVALIALDSDNVQTDIQSMLEYVKAKYK